MDLDGASEKKRLLLQWKAEGQKKMTTQKVTWKKKGLATVRVSKA